MAEIQNTHRRVIMVHCDKQTTDRVLRIGRGLDLFNGEKIWILLDGLLGPTEKFTIGSPIDMFHHHMPNGMLAIQNRHRLIYDPSLLDSVVELLGKAALNSYQKQIIAKNRERKTISDHKIIKRSNDDLKHLAGLASILTKSNSSSSKFVFEAPRFRAFQSDRFDTNDTESSKFLKNFTMKQIDQTLRWNESLSTPEMPSNRLDSRSNSLSMSETVERNQSNRTLRTKIGKSRTRRIRRNPSSDDSIRSRMEYNQINRNRNQMEPNLGPFACRASSLNLTAEQTAIRYEIFK